MPTCLHRHAASGSCRSPRLQSVSLHLRHQAGWWSPGSSCWVWQQRLPCRQRNCRQDGSPWNHQHCRRWQFHILPSVGHARYVLSSCQGCRYPYLRMHLPEGLRQPSYPLRPLRGQTPWWTCWEGSWSRQPHSSALEGCSWWHLPDFWQSCCSIQPFRHVLPCGAYPRHCWHPSPVYQWDKGSLSVLLTNNRS